MLKEATNYLITCLELNTKAYETTSPYTLEYSRSAIGGYLSFVGPLEVPDGFWWGVFLFRATEGSFPRNGSNLPTQ